jgi:ankyrin repeat protein
MKPFVLAIPLSLMVGLLLGAVPWVRSTDFALHAVSENRPSLLRLYFLLGGNANVRTSEGSLLFVATGPHGGHAVLALLVQHGSDPNRGFGRYTPLMNAASWCDIEGARMLIAAHANPLLKNERNQTALDTVCLAPESEAAAVSDYLRSVMASNNAWSGRES